MVADLSKPAPNTLGPERRNGGIPTADSKNRVLHLLVRRLNSSKSFGENMIFMLNRASMCIRSLLLGISSDIPNRSYG